MSFKITKNLETNKETYFIDGKRVSQDKFIETEILLNIKGYNKNSMIGWTEKKFSYFCFSMD